MALHLPEDVGQELAQQRQIQAQYMSMHFEVAKGVFAKLMHHTCNEKDMERNADTACKSAAILLKRYGFGPVQEEADG